MATFDREQFRKVFHESGLTKVELTQLYGVSRQTLYSWQTHGPSNSIIAERAVAYTSALTAAMTRGVLPLPATLDRRARSDRLVQMAQALYKLTAPKSA